MVGNETTNKRPVFSGKSKDFDGMPIRSAGHLGEFKVPVRKQYDEWLQR